MKTIALLRHAKSSWDDPVERDFDRPLNAKGRRAAVTMGAHFKDAGLTWGVVVASPATRVIETMDGVEEGLGRRLDAALDKRIYMAGATTLLDIVHDARAEAERLLLIGHNPGLEDLIFLLTPADGGAYRQAVDVKYPTATYAEMAFDVANWTEIDSGRLGELTVLVRPRDLDAELGPDG
ncbi:MAG: histidine phosphatase family protein [Pacificimonas sp.]